MNGRSVILTSGSADETFALGVRLGEALRDGDFVGLVGQLGAGKTLFSRGVAQGVGVPLDDVSSPTYSIIQSYRGRIALHHADLYRLTSEADLYATGFFDLFEGPGAFLVEWIDNVPSAAPTDHLRVVLAVVTPDTRRLVASSSGEASEALLDRWIPES